LLCGSRTGGKAKQGKGNGKSGGKRRDGASAHGPRISRHRRIETL
jgi:hypothetical protein